MSILHQDFTKACRTFLKQWQRLEYDKNSWDNVNVLESFGTEYLRISRRLPLPSKNGNASTSEGYRADESEDEIHENDDEILQHSNNKPEKVEILINYDIIHSPSYQVPVLYITFQQRSATGTSPQNFHPSPEELYDLLVPSPHRAQLQDVGILGALSMTDHPLSDRPVYFVHPCRTAEAMAGLLSGSEEGGVRPEVYLMMWFGLVGGVVGVDVPVGLAERLLTSPPSHLSSEEEV